jgi:hypothetical protein
MDKQITIIIKANGQKLHAVDYCQPSYLQALTHGMLDVESKMGTIIDKANAAEPETEDDDDED